MLKERYKKIVDYHVDCILNNVHPEFPFISSVNNDIHWIIRIRQIQMINFENINIENSNSFSLKMDVLLPLSRKVSHLQNFFNQEWTFKLEDKASFIDETYPSFKYMIGFSFCKCGKYKFNDYKTCFHCYLTIPYHNNECPVCYEKIFDHPHWIHKEKCCGTVLCKDCKQKTKNKCIICRHEQSDTDDE